MPFFSQRLAARRGTLFSCGLIRRPGKRERLRRAGGERRRESSSVQTGRALSLLKAAEQLRSGSLSSVDLLSQARQRIEETSELNFFITRSEEAALRAAQEADRTREEKEREKETVSPLLGIPIAVKDNFCTRDIRTTCASKILENFVPPYESTATSRLWEAGAVPLGKLNMDEFGMGSATLFSHYGPTVNPWSPPQLGREGERDKEREEASRTEDEGTRKVKREPALVAGGSSGGSAAAVASHCCFAALGSDTGGSVRQPAAYCGVVGLKPTYGLISRWGLVSYASSLDTVGIITRTVRDSAAVLDCVAGPDSKDSTCIPERERPDINYLQSLEAQHSSLSGLTVGIPAEFRVKELPNDILDSWTQAVRWLIDAGANVVSVSLPSVPLSLPAYYVIASAEASSNLSRYDGVRYGARSSLDLSEASLEGAAALHQMISRTRSENFGLEVKRRILSGCFVLSEGAYSDYYERALATREAIRRDFDRVFQAGVDVLLTPTAPSGPFPLSSRGTSPVEMYGNDIMTIPPSMAGLPALSLPTGVTPFPSARVQERERSGNGREREGNSVFSLPLAVQVVGPPFGEERVFRIALAIEERANFARQIPSYVTGAWGRGAREASHCPGGQKK